MVPPAPGLFSTRKAWWRSAASFALTTRATMSTVPPAVNGTSTRTGLAGYTWARTGAATSRQTDAAKTCRRRRVIESSPIRWRSGARPVRLDLGAMHQATRGRIERVSPVQRAAVVPDQHVSHPPLLAEHVLGSGGVRPEFVEQCFALVQVHSDDGAVAPAAEEQTLAAGLRMRADERMARSGRFARVGHFRVAFAPHSSAVVSRVVDRLAAFDPSLEVRRERLVGEIHVRPVSVAARRRQLDCIKDRRLRRVVDVSHIGVPDRFSVAEAADRRAALLDVGDDVHLGMLGEKGLAVRVRPRRIELAELL